MSTGRLVGTVVGGVVGFFLPPVGLSLGAAVGGALGDLVAPPKTPTIEGPRLSDLSVQTSTYGAPIPRVYGTITLAGNLIWLENNKLKEKSKKSGGGKGGGKGGGAKTRTYTYSATFAVALCQGPIVGVRRLWLGPNLVYDAGATDHETIRASNQAASLFTLYPGSDTQGPDPRIQATIGVNHTPAWRGLAYLVISDLPLAKYGNSLLGAQVKAEVVTAGMVTDYGVTAQTAPMAQGARIVWHRDRFIASEFDGKIWTSPTGETGTWTLRYDDAAAGEFRLATNGEICVLTRFASPFVLTSYDGVTWVQRVVPDWLGTSQLVDVVAGGRGFLASADCTAGVQWFALSPDGITWYPQAVPASGVWFTPLWNGSVYVVLNGGGASGIWTSPSGMEGTWTLTYTTAMQYYRATVLNGRFILGGNDSSTLTSDDGYTWTLHPAALPGSAEAMDALGEVAICLRYGTFSVSSDGVNWTEYPMAVAQSGWNGLASNGAVWLAYRDSGIAYTILPRSLASAAITLADIVSAECLGSGLLASGDIDVSSLTDTVRGYRIGAFGTLRSALEPLQAAWPFDIRQHGYQIEFVRRGVAGAVVTVPAADLDARPDGQAPGVQITLQREIDAQLPRRVSVQYLDAEREYDTGAQYAERLNSSALNETLLDLPIALTGAEAAGMAEVLLYLAWLNRTEVAFSLPPTYAYLECADVVNLTTPEGVLPVLLQAIDYTSDQRLDCKGRPDRPALYQPAALGVTPATTGPTTIATIGPATLVLLDLPRLTSLQDSPLLLVAMAGGNDVWPGGALLRSLDDGASFDQPLEVFPPGATIGSTGAALGVVDSRVVDTASRLTVTLASGSLESVSRALMFAGANHFAYGEDGRWEVIAAANCTLISGSDYALTDLLRGVAGTEWAMGLHVDGDRLIALDTDSLESLPIEIAALGQERLYRAVTFGLEVSSGLLRAQTWRAVQFKPLAPCLLTGERDAGTGDWLLYWVRRTRMGSTWRDQVDADLGESAESYWVEIYQDGTYATLLRTIISSAAFAAYTSAQQTTDFGGNQTTLYLRIYQYSTVVGCGYPLTAEITR